MALYPGAVKELIPPGSNDPAIIPIGVILHVDAGNVGDLHDYFDGPSGGIESHFHIPKTGSPYQYRDTSREADANYHGNSFEKNGKTYGFISVETQGLAAGEWNDHQIAEIKKLLLWANKTHGIPLRRCPAWNEAGIGWHVMWGAPGPWTPRAKVCPGPDRVKQFDNVLVPWFAHATEPEEEDMPNTREEIKEGAYDANEQYGLDFWVAAKGTGTDLRKKVAAILQQTAGLNVQIAGLTAAVKALAQNQGVDPDAILAAVTAATKDGVDKALADLKITLTTDDGSPA